MAYPLLSLSAKLDFERLMGPVEKCGRVLTRLDERLKRSPELAEGFRVRSHFWEAHATSWLEGELVPMEDLVLHEAQTDVRLPTQELGRAHHFMQLRKRVERQEHGWCLEPGSLLKLAGREEDVSNSVPASKETSDSERDEDEMAWQALFADLDKVSKRANALVSGDVVELDTMDQSSKGELDTPRHSSMDQWHQLHDVIAHHPPMLAAAILLDAWLILTPIENQARLGRVMAADYLRTEICPNHLPLVAYGLYRSSFRWRRTDALHTRLIMLLAGFEKGATEGLNQLNRLAMARERMARACVGRRRNSRLPDFAALFVANPYVSIPMARKKLDVTAAAVDRMIEQMGGAMPRELTGRGRYRAWGIV
jgi:hypothetical protein